MKNRIIYLLVVAASIAASGCAQNSSIESVKLETSIDSASYALGVLIGSDTKSQLETLPGYEELNMDALIAALKLTTTQDEPPMTVEDASAIFQDFYTGQSEREGQKNLEEGNAFLEQNKTREGVVTTESGLQYEIITEGTGEKPTAEDQVRVHYNGTLIDGTVFDSSIGGDPVEFPLNGVIEGWTEVLQLMPVGSKWKVYLPADLAYGEMGAGGVIGPNETLIFEIELLGIVE